MRLIVALTAVALVIAAPSFAQRHSASASTQMMAAATDLASRFESSWNAADGSAYGEAYWPEAELVDPTGRVWNSRQAIVRTHLDLWARGRSQARASVRRVRRLTDRLMIVDIVTTVCGFTQLPPGARGDSRGCVWSNLKHVAEKRGGEWKIFASQNTFAPPPEGS